MPSRAQPLSTSFLLRAPSSPCFRHRPLFPPLQVRVLSFRQKGSPLNHPKQAGLDCHRELDTAETQRPPRIDRRDDPPSLGSPAFLIVFVLIYLKLVETTRSDRSGSPWTTGWAFQTTHSPGLSEGKRTSCEASQGCTAPWTTVQTLIMRNSICTNLATAYHFTAHLAAVYLHLKTRAAACPLVF